MIYFTADTHFWHRNIVKYQPSILWDDVITYNKVIIERWNNSILPSDTVYIIGDFCFGGVDKTNEMLGKLKGNKILIKGNHDIKPHKANWTAWYDVKFVSHEGYNFYLSHYPAFMWQGMHKGTIHLHGHTHDQTEFTNSDLYYEAKKRFPIINVGIQNHDWMPLSLTKVISLVKKDYQYV